MTRVRRTKIFSLTKKDKKSIIMAICITCLGFFLEKCLEGALAEQVNNTQYTVLEQLIDIKKELEQLNKRNESS